jgi:hypothetical protein
VQRVHKSLTGGQPVLASAQFVDPIEIPPPHVYIDTTYRADDGDDRAWADRGISNAEKVELTWPQEDGLQPTKANLQYESDSVVATEDKTALAESLIDFFADKDFGEQMCNVLNYADTLISAATFNPNDPNQVADAILSLKSRDGAYAPGVVAQGIKSTYMTFEQAFPQCNSTIGSIKWIIEQFKHLFCPDE